MKTTLSPNTIYKIKKVEDLDKFFINEFVLYDAKETLGKYFEENKEPLTMKLVGTEHNYNWQKENYEKILPQKKMAEELLAKQLDSGEISQEEHEQKISRVIVIFDQSEKDIRSNIEAYEEYYKEYGTYDIIQFSDNK